MRKTKIEPKPQAVEPNLKTRCFALAYAKDLAVAGKIRVEQMIYKAYEFDTYLNGK